MKSLSKLALLISASLSASAFAQSIEGVIRSANGQPIAKAKIIIEGTDLQTVSDTEGRFLFNQLNTGINELHITASGFAHSHQDIEVPVTGITDLSFTLKRSPIEVIDIVSTPLHLSSMESAMPVSVLSDEDLRRQQSATLGDTLENLPGIHSSAFANVASTPIIRGLSGPRVQIAQNGLDVSDASRVGPDHSVASEASTATQIEVLRGPATLFYGSGAIGGVVNVVDNRVPTDSETRGEALIEHSSVNDQKLGSFNITTGSDNFAFYADAFSRKSNDYEIPVAAEAHDEHDDEHEEHEEEHNDFVVENTHEKSYGFTLGGSYLFDGGYIGLAVEKLDREYGIPGHSHGEEAHEEDGHEDDHEEEHEESVYAELEQTRAQLLGEFNFKEQFINKLNLRAGYTDYEHAEIEEGMIGTVFQNQTEEFRIDAEHQLLNEWRGGLSFHYKNSKASALGEEAFTPASDTSMLALALMEERHFGNVLVQLGARVESVKLKASHVILPEVELHGHDEEEHLDDHVDDHIDGDEHNGEDFPFDRTYTPISLSAGAVWNFSPDYNVGIAVSRSERAPSAVELFSFGPHIATGTHEVGALFDIHTEGGESHIELNETNPDLETSNNIDLTFRKKTGNVGFIFNVFYNSIDNYYYQKDTDLVVHVEAHDHGDEHSEDVDSHEEESELPLFLYKQNDVILNGFEAQVAWQVNDEFKTELFADFVRARLKDGGDLPKTPPLRFGTKFSYATENISANLAVTRYQSQERTAEFETPTDGYTLVDASIAYDLPVYNLSVYVKGDNLTDTEARLHTSFLKALAPRPGRNISIGLKGYF